MAVIRQEYMTYKTYINQLCGRLREHFFLSEYRMDVRFMHEEKHPRDGHPGTVAADVRTDSRYLNFTVTVYPITKEFFDKKDYSSIGEIMVHEFCHLLTHPLTNIAFDAISNASEKFLNEIDERQTQRITNIIFNQLPKHFYMPKKKPVKKVAKKAKKK